MITNREDIVSKLRTLNEQNASEVLESLVDKYDEEGKNPPIIALEEGLFEAYTIMIKPVMTKNGYKIYYDPFNNGVIRGTKPLVWNGIFCPDPDIYPTRTKFYSIYSPYSYLENMAIDPNIKRMLMNSCHEIDYDIISGMQMANIPVKDQIKSELYTDEDIIRYVPIPLHKIIKKLIDNNIPLNKYTSNRYGYIEVVIDYNKLSEENKEIAMDLLSLIEDNFVISKINHILEITMIARNEETIEDIERELNRILGNFKYQELTKYKLPVEEVYKRTYQFLTVLGKPVDNSLTRVELCKRANPLLTLSSDGKYFYDHPAVKERDEQRRKTLKGV